MITIKEFASLCQCNTQTPRYYDKIDLLKPVKVDPWSGYRYYEEHQAIDFVKIKNLQAADFSIAEIKGLLTKSDDQVYTAFEEKILKTRQKLEQIQEIQRTYLTEKSNMENTIKGLCGYLIGQVRDMECLREFGLDPKDGPDIKARVQAYMEACLGKGLPEPKKTTVIIDDDVFHGEDSPKFLIHLDENNPPDTILIGEENIAEEGMFDPAKYDILWDHGGWTHVHEFIDIIPRLEPDTDYCFRFLLNAETYREDLSFPLFMVGAMLCKGYGPETSMSCSVERSEDGRNHFSLLRRKEE